MVAIDVCEPNVGTLSAFGVLDNTLVYEIVDSFVDVPMNRAVWLNAQKVSAPISSQIMPADSVCLEEYGQVG